MMHLSEETGFGDVATLKKSHRTDLCLDERIQCYMFTENTHSLCLERTAVEKPLLSYYSGENIYEISLRNFRNY